MKNIIQKITRMPIILGLQIIASFMFIFFLLKLGALPMLYACILIAIICLLDIGLFFLMKNDQSDSTKQLFQRS